MPSMSLFLVTRTGSTNSTYLFEQSSNYSLVTPPILVTAGRSLSRGLGADFLSGDHSLHLLRPCQAPDFNKGVGARRGRALSQ